ncbi:MAG: hypothetical protein P1U32_05230 [Legionellaceae bacterium]|nr:hypothetical protein [Legionellaceae bacterium]
MKTLQEIENELNTNRLYQSPAIQAEVEMNKAFMRVKKVTTDPLILTALDKILALGENILASKFAAVILHDEIEKYSMKAKTSKEKPEHLTYKHKVFSLLILDHEVTEMDLLRQELINEVNAALRTAAKENRHERMNEAKEVPRPHERNIVNHEPQSSGNAARYKKNQSQQRKEKLLCSNAYPGNFMTKKARKEAKERNEAVWHDAPSRPSHPSGR